MSKSLMVVQTWVTAPKTIKEKQSWIEVKAVKIDFTEKQTNRGRDSSIDLGSIPNTSRTRGIYSQGASWGWGWGETSVDGKLLKGDIKSGVGSG